MFLDANRRPHVFSVRGELGLEPNDHIPHVAPGSKENVVDGFRDVASLRGQEMVRVLGGYFPAQRQVRQQRVRELARSHAFLIVIHIRDLRVPVHGVLHHPHIPPQSALFIAERFDQALPHEIQGLVFMFEMNEDLGVGWKALVAYRAREFVHVQ